MKNRRNHYRLLQVQPDASQEVIRASYRTLMLQLKQHPDLGGSAEQASFLNEAYRVLSNPALRKAYDQTLASRGGRFRFAEKARGEDTCGNCGRPLPGAPGSGARCPACSGNIAQEKTSAGKQAHHRAMTRMSIGEEITYFSASPGTPQAAKMMDFSPEGMRLLCSEKLIPNKVLKIRSRIFEATGRITNVHEVVVGGKCLYAIGLSFLSVRYEDSRGAFVSASV